MNEELKAADGLLDIGISIPLRPVRFRKWSMVPRVTMKRPPLGGLLRILRVYLELNVTPDELKKMSEEESRTFMARHGKEVAILVSLSVWSGFFSGKFARLLAWWLLWRCHPNVLFHAAMEFSDRIDSQSFTTIIRSYASQNLMRPNLSHEKKRS